MTLRLRSSDRVGDVLVSSSCLAAPLDPCQFRRLIAAAVAGQVAVFGQFDEVEVVGGMVYLGGGLYQPSHPGGADDRWFVTALGHRRVGELLATCPLPEASGDAFSVLVKPDDALGRTAIRVRCDDRDAARHHDEVAMWALTTCLIGELVDETCRVADSRPQPRPAPRSRNAP